MDMSQKSNQESEIDKTQHDLKLYRSLFDKAGKGLILHREGVVVDANDMLLKLLGYTIEELRGQLLSSILPSPLYKVEFEHFLKDDQETDYVMIGEQSDGAEIPLSLAVEVFSNSDYSVLSVEAIKTIKNDKRSSAKSGILPSAEEFKEKGRKFEALFNVSFNAYIIDKLGKIVEVNEMFTGLFGYRKDEAVNLIAFADLFKDKAEYASYLKNVKVLDRTCFVGKFKRKNGALFNAEIIAKDEILDGESVRIVTIRDVSDLEESERDLKERNEELISRNHDLQLMSNEVVSSRQSFYQAIQEKHSSLSEKDLNNVIVYGRWSYDFTKKAFSWSDEVKEIIDYDTNESIMSLSDFLKQVHSDDIEEMQNILFSPKKANRLFNFEFRYVTRNGVGKVLQAQGIAESDAKHRLTSLFGTVLDITERKRIENKLKRQKDHYMKLNEELIISRKKAEESEKLKTSFFANMSHEIRTPMNGILGFSGLLMEPELSNEERLEYSQVIVDSGKRLLHIVNDILDISKLESDTFKISKTDVHVNHLLDTLYSLFGQDEKVQSGDIVFSLHKADADECTIHTDHNRLSQILTNLLSNAMKFTNKGKVDFGYRLVGDALNFFVKDTGIGVPDDMQTIIFEPFRQVEGHLVKAHGGTGLGLSISKKLTELLGGEMSMESHEGEGTSFEFTLPYEHKQVMPAHHKAMVSQYELKEQIKDVCLLIAEDDDINYLFFKSFLGTRLTLLRAVNGQEAIDMVKAHPEIDIVLMDVKMPVMDGLEATKRLKVDYPNLPIIVQTAYAMIEDKEEVFRAGANDYLTKPINRRDLLEKIKKLCIK